MRRKNGTEKFEINIWAVIETVTSKSDQASIKAENKLLRTKTGLARAAIRHFMNNQVLDCYLQGELDTSLMAPTISALSNNIIYVT